ncbi:MAG: ComEC/Rec2 family competence protein [Microgenomates group bacterium]
MKIIWPYIFWSLAIFFCLFVDRADILKIIKISLPFSEAGILGGMILGDKGGFTKEFYNNLIGSGLVHLVVVSGSNVMLLVGGGIEVAARWIGRRGAILMGLMIGWKYVLMVNWEIPIVRAMLLISIMYLAQLLGRKYNLVRGVILAVVIMFVADPKIMTSVSFWLSITAFLSIVLYNDVFRIKNDFINELGRSVWVNVWIFPIIAFVFGKTSWVSPLANMMVVVLVEFITIVGTMGSLLGLVWLTLGKYVLWLLIPSLGYLGKVVNWGGQINSWQINFNEYMLIGYYLVLGYFLLKKHYSSR